MEQRTKTEELISRLKEEVRSRIDLSREVTDEEVKELIFHVITEYAKEEYISLEDRKRLATSVFNSLRKLDFIQELLEDEEVSEIMINGPGEIFVEKRGIISPYEGKFESTEKLEDMIQQIVAPQKVVINKAMSREIELLKKRLEDKDKEIAELREELNKYKKMAETNVLNTLKEL